MQTSIRASDVAARIEDVDLLKPLDDSTFEAVQRSWMD
jgi:hypothetical protein